MPNPPPHIALPDELLQSILSPHLEVPDHLFADTEETSPFATPTESSSSLLLVCKAWMRAATPLLYEVVILRSKAQALALERTLKKSNELGRCIKKLRLEGGSGAPMAKIITEAPNIKELCMTMQVWPTDTVSGLTKALQLIQPERVILGRGLDPDDNFASMDNRSTRAIIDKLCSCIEKE